LLRRDRIIVLAALLSLAIVAWAYLFWVASQMSDTTAAGMSMEDMGTVMAPHLVPWTPGHALFVFTMWAVMMVGMMTPSAAAMVLIYAQVARQGRVLGQVFAPAGWFTCGYLLTWILFALVATAAQYGLERNALLSPMMVSTSRYFGGACLMVAGLYQLSPLKTACLSQCRAPLSFVQRHGGFQANARGSLRLGALHGLYCVGCCWALMTLLFVFGVMNILWIAGLAIVVLAERTIPGARYLSMGVGVALFVVGGRLLVT
jgi:predicted metal-binding membrane protein